MVSEKEIEAAREAWREYWSDVVGQYDDNKDPMEGMRRALEAAARVREEANNECGEAAHPAPQPSVKVKPLEWVASDDWEYRWIADLYAIKDQGKNWSTDRYWLYYNGQRLGKFGTLDTALFTAQADYDRRILSALTAGKPEQAVPSGWKRNRYECPTCGGSGEIAPDAECPDCDGTGACVPTSPTAGGGDA
jgi:DnaJ-class molecular chaperone with C-terminal Zn finger domain